jgi:hypothetical protein
VYKLLLEEERMMVQQHMDSVSEIARAQSAKEEEAERMRQAAVARRGSSAESDLGSPGGAGQGRRKEKRMSNGIGARLLQGMRGSLKTTAVEPPALS